MAYFENIDIKKLLEEDEDYSFPPFTEKDLEETEKAIGWKLPKSYIALLKIQNGGYINYEEFDECWLSAIYGISSSEGGLIDMFDMFKDAVLTQPQLTITATSDEYEDYQQIFEIEQEQ